MRRAPLTHPAALYRHFDEHGVLLYVGISHQPDERLRQHRLSSWWGQLGLIDRVEVEWFPDRASAAAAECAAIERERPRCNLRRRLRKRRNPVPVLRNQAQEGGSR